MLKCLVFCSLAVDIKTLIYQHLHTYSEAMWRASLFQQALRNSYELLRHRKELHTSSCNCMQAHETSCMYIHGTSCKLRELHENLCICMHTGTFLKILHTFRNFLYVFWNILQCSGTFCNVQEHSVMF